MLQFPLISTDISPLLPLVEKIQILGQALTHIPLNHQLQQYIFHQQILKSSLFSAQIEGNSLTLTKLKDINLDNPQEKSSLEISNVLKALQGLAGIHYPLDLPSMLKLHAQIMNGLSSQAGKLRTESSAIFDQFGNAVYLTPNVEEMQLMLNELIAQINQNYPDLIHQLINIANCHYYFEKTHPFIDGNGRTGRAILHFQLYQTKLFGDYLLPLDEFLAQNKADYYYFLEKNDRQTSGLISFFLEGLIWSAQTLLDQIKNSLQNEPALPNALSLLPRRQEILHIIADHPYASLDLIIRRFPTIPSRTLAYDINYLVKNNFLIKHGQTRGVRYSVLKS